MNLQALEKTYTTKLNTTRQIDDQKRTVTIEQAFINGADYSVVGRPIRDAEDPRKAAEDTQQTIRSLFG